MGAEPLDVHTPVVLQRWRRFGHDRVYVKRGELDLGYRDLKSGDVRCDDAANLGLVAQVTAEMFARAEAAHQPEYQPRHARPDTAPAMLPAIPATALLPLSPDHDLALNLPGQAARAQAQQLRAAAPVRTFVARLMGAKTDERNWRVGAEREEHVARVLAALGAGWQFLHAVPVGDRGSDIDHVVIGPGGVFTINAKHHPQANVWVRGDKFKVNAVNQHYVRNSRHESARAAKLLSAAAGFDVEVHGIIAVLGAHRVAVVEQPRDRVCVISGHDLARFIAGFPPALGAPSIARIYDVARHLSTWQPKTARRAEPPTQP